MPVVASSAYATVEGVLNLTRSLINDMLVDANGEILTDTNPATFPMLNECADYMEKELANRGVKTFVKETILSPITPFGLPPDPGLQVNLTDAGYFDGFTNFNPPQLPTDLLQPLDLWERRTGSQNYWKPMKQRVDGLAAQIQGNDLRNWEWRQDGIYMPGAIESRDLRLRYESETMQFVAPTDSIQIRGAQSALANLLAAVFTNSRDPQSAAVFSAAGDKFISQIATMNTRARQRVTVSRRSYGRNRALGFGTGFGSGSGNQF